jgi:Arabinose-binding domain of AraC transcription regulator, N-term
MARIYTATINGKTPAYFNGCIEVSPAHEVVQAVSQFICHDFRALVRHLLGFVHVLHGKTYAHLDNTNRDYLDTILESGKKLSVLMDDFLRLARRGQIGTHRDLPKFLRAMSNLISNTVKSTGTRSPGRIEIGARTSTARKPIISLRGNGVGFDHAHELCGHPQEQKGSRLQAVSARPMISVAAATGLLEAIAARGGDADQILRKFGIDRSVFSEPEGFIPSAIFAGILEEAAQATADDCFGLHLGENYNPRNIGPLVYVVLNSPTIRAGIENFERYLQVYNEAAKWFFTSEGNRGYIRYLLTDLGIDSLRQSNEYGMTR